MADAGKINFKTPSGLKIRLNHRYFFYQMTKIDKRCTEDEIVNNSLMYNATKRIDSSYIIPITLVQMFTIFAIIFHICIPTFCFVSVGLYVLGCIWRCLIQDILLSNILIFFSSIYKMLWWLFYLALAICFFVFDGVYLIIPYIVTRIVCCVFALLQNNLVSSVTHKKYGLPFNDTEICAFRVFRFLSKSSLKMEDYIRDYVSAIFENGDRVHGG